MTDSLYVHFPALVSNQVKLDNHHKHTANKTSQLLSSLSSTFQTFSPDILKTYFQPSSLVKFHNTVMNFDKGKSFDLMGSVKIVMKQTGGVHGFDNGARSCGKVLPE